jgi:predicted subunit of tRNA(5-methylaminomethyl-2-thiouridylate) methyltransferase
MKEAVVLFSGGIDSSYTALKMADDFDKLLLVTYRTPGMINLSLAVRSADRIKKVSGGKTEHRVLDIRDEVYSSRGGIFKCLRDNCKYHFFYSWCLGCKLAMHLKTIEICENENIRTVMDGSSAEDAHALEQNIHCKGFFKELYSAHDIEYMSPFYEENGDRQKLGPFMELLRKIGLHKPPTGKKAAYLNKRGVPTGRALFSQYRSIQPSCLTNLLFNIPRIILRSLFGEKKSDYLRYLEDSCKNADTGSGRHKKKT